MKTAPLGCWPLPKVIWTPTPVGVNGVVGDGASGKLAGASIVTSVGADRDIPGKRTTTGPEGSFKVSSSVAPGWRTEAVAVGAVRKSWPPERAVTPKAAVERTAK